MKYFKYKKRLSWSEVCIIVQRLYNWMVSTAGRTLKFSPDCSGILFMEQSGIKRFSGKRDSNLLREKTFRFKNKFYNTIYKFLPIILFLVGCQFCAFNPVKAQTVVCPADTDLGTYDCTNFDDLPNQGVIIGGIIGPPYNIQVTGSSPATSVTTIDSDLIFYCESNAREITRSVIVYNDNNFNFVYDTGEEVGICDFTISTIADDNGPVFTVPQGIALPCGSDPLDNSIAGDVLDLLDGCSEATISSSIVDTEVNTPCADSTTYTKRWEATDECGNMTVKYQTIIVDCSENCITEVCRCITGDFIAYAAAEPGTFETVDHTQLYILTDAGGNVITSSTLGIFPGLMSDTDYFIYAANVANDDLTNFQNNLTTIAEVSSMSGVFAEYCYELNTGIATYNCACICPTMGEITTTGPICAGESFDIILSGIANIDEAENNTSDYQVLFSYYNGVVANPDPYTNSPDGYIDGGLLPIDSTIILTGVGLDLGVGTYTVVAWLDDFSIPSIPPDCAPSVATVVTIFEEPFVDLGEDITACEGESIVLDAGNESSMTIWSPTGETTSAITVTSSGNYIVNIEDTNGCMASDEVTITFIDAFEVDNPVSICSGNSYTLPDGMTVSTSGNYPVTLTSTQGCDSIVTTILSVDEVLTSDNPVTICEGENYTLPDGSVINTAGTYLVTLNSTQGCDSIVTTILTVDEVLTSDNTAAICEGENYTLPDGSVINTAGTYSVTLTSTQGCDSIVTTIVTVDEVLTSDNSVTICEGENYTLPDGVMVSTSGTYPVTLTSTQGCDSIITTILSVDAVLTSDNSVTICEGENYTLPDGSIVNAAGTYPVTLTSVLGCDSIITTILSVDDVLTSDNSVSICEGDSYTLPDGVMVSTAGTYPVTLTSTQGCDSIITTILSVDEVLTADNLVIICEGENYTLPDGSVINAAGTYPITLTSTQGCDSIVNTILTISPSTHVDATVTICAGESYVLADGSLVSSDGTYPVTIPTIEGCDSTINTILTVDQSCATEVCDCENGIFTAYATAEPGSHETIDYTNVYLLTDDSGTILTSNYTGLFPNLYGNTTYTIYAANVKDEDLTAFEMDLSAISDVINQTGNYAMYCYELNDSTAAYICACEGFVCPTIGQIETSTTICAGFIIDITISGISNTLQAENGEAGFDILIGAYNSSVTNPDPYATAPEIVLNEGNALTPYNGTVTLNGVGPLNNPGIFTVVAYLSPTPTGDDTCQPFTVLEVMVNETPAELGQSEPVTACIGDQVVFTAPDGYDYLWATDSNQQTFTVFNSTSLPVTIINESGCSQTLIYEAVFNDAPNEPQPTVVNLCEGSNITLTAPANYTYLWQDGSTTSTIEVNQSDTYVLTISNAEGCSQDLMYEVNLDGLNEPQPPAISICGDEVATLTAPNGYTYLWQDGSNTQSIQVSNPGNYVLTISVGDDCTQNLIYVVNEGTGLSESNPLPIDICEGEQATLTAPTGYNYLWYDGSTSSSITVAASGLYTLEISNNSGCAQTLNYVVNSADAPNQLQPESTTACEGDVVNLQASSGFSYVWDDGTQASNYNVTTSGNYNVTISNGCEQVLTYEVTFLPLPTITFQTVNPTACGANNGMILLSFTGVDNGVYDLRYKGGEFNNVQVNNGTATITGLSPGIYNYITITDENGCEAITDGLVEINESGEILPPPSLSSGSTFCESNNVESIMAVGEPFANFSWYSDVTLINALNSGDYYITKGVNETVYVTQNVLGSCESEALEVNIIFNPAVSLDSKSYEVCANEIGADLATVDLYLYEPEIANSGGLWSDENGVIIDPTDYTFSSNTNLSYQINNENGCEATAVVKIKVNTVIPKSINIARCTFENGNVINLRAFAVINGLPDTGIWSSGGIEIDVSEFFILMEPMQVFKYDYIDENGCPNQLTTNITLEQAPIITAKAVCAGVENFNQYFIEVTSLKNVSFNDVIVTDGNTTETVSGNGTTTFGPYTHSGIGLTTTTFEAYFDGTTGCSMTLEVLETYCPEPEPCNCANAPNAGTILGQAEPGSFSFIDFQQSYVLTDDAGTILQNNHTGLFTELENGNYNVYAINAEAIDASGIVTALNTVANISSLIPDKSYGGFCYTIQGPAAYEVACACFPFVCPEIGSISTTDAVCEGSTFDINVSGIINSSLQENNETDFGILIGYYNEIVALPDPYTNPPDGLFNGGNAVNPENDVAELTGMGADLLDGRYTIVAYLSEVPDDTNCRPMVRLFTEVFDTPELYPAANPICEGSTGLLISGVAGGTFPYTIQWTDPAGVNYPVQNFTIHLATQENTGTYQVSVTDVKGCTSSEIVEVMIVEDGTAPYVPVEVCEEIPGGAVEATVNLNEIEALMSAPGGSWRDRSGNFVSNPESVFLVGTNEFRFEYFLETQGNCDREQVMIININSIEVTEDIRSSVCRESALSFDLTAFENEAGLSNGSWSDENGVPIENATAVNLTDGLQFIYSVKDEDGCDVPTDVSFNILEDVYKAPIQSLVCSGNTLAFDLTIFENEVNLSNGVWLDQNENPIENLTNINLIDAGLQLVYSVQIENGCYENTAVIFTIQEDLILEEIQASVCSINALAFDLIAFENEVNLSDGIWLDQNSNLIENTSAINLTEPELQLFYAVQNEDGCFTKTGISFTFLEDINFKGIEASVCSEAALSVDLTSFENEINQPGDILGLMGVWLDENGIPVNDATNVNLLEVGLQFIYSLQDESGCNINTALSFTLKEDVQINAVARCVGESNEDGFVIDVIEITGGDGGNIYQLLVGEVAFMYEGGTATFGPFQFNDGAVEIMAASSDDASCNQMLSIAPLYCGDSPVFCDCTNLTNPVSVQVMAEPGSYNADGYSNVYLLTISNGTVVDFNTTGQFTGLLRNTDYYVYASNVEDIDYSIYEAALNGANIDDIRVPVNNEFANICYELNAGVAQFNENCICVDCEAGAGLATLLEGGLDIVCQGDSIGPFVVAGAATDNFSYGWLVTSGAPDYIIDTLVEGRGASFASDFDLESEPGTYCVHGVSIFGDFDLFEDFIFAQSITTGEALLVAIQSGQTCADFILEDCIPVEVNANPLADIESSVNLCSTEDGLYPTSIDLNDLIITSTEGSTGNWYANFEDSIPVASTIVSALDKPLGASTYFFVAGEGDCESIRYVTKVNVLDCTERICNYALLSSEGVCNTDGTFSLVIDVVIEDPLSNEFFVVLNETEYGPFMDTDSIGIEQITLEGLTGEAGETDIIIKDRDSDLSFEPTPAFISEIHYQNFGPSEGEGLEITALAGTDLGNYSIILYNGNGGAAYNSLTLGSIIPDEGNGYGTYVLNFPLQNGPDAIALVDNTNPAYPVILQLISYEGSFFVTDGLAMGMQTSDIGVFEPGEVGESLQLTDVGWIGPVSNTMGSINNNLSLQLEPEQINCAFNYVVEIPSCGACELNPMLTPVDCDLDASTYYLEIAINATNPFGSQYTVDLAFSGFPVFNYGSFDYDGANAVIGPFQADEITSYEFLIQDVDSEDCNTTSFFGPYNCLDQPIVLARDAGELPKETQMVCSENEIEVKTVGAKVTQGTELCYLLHDGSNITIGKAIAFNNTGKFKNNGNLPLNVELCITAVLGNATNGDTMPTEIYDTSNCTPVVFLKPMQLESSVNCNYQTGKYTVEFSFNGGLPEYLTAEPYLVKNKDNVWYGNTLSTNPVISGKGYHILVSDANGCSSSYSSEPVICDKLYLSLVAFDAKIANAGNILDWMTEYEIDNSFFTLERSFNGIDYEAIVQKKGQGNSNQLNAYQHVDAKVQNGITHYRLMQTAFDGTVRQVGYKVLSREAQLIEMDYLLPNPTTGQLYSGIHIQSKGKLMFEIVDVTGRILDQSAINADKGLLELQFDVSAYTDGIYFIKLSYGDYSIHQKFIKQ